ncbi:MAG TPA: hypothetical protein VET85_10390, partial [Stellaceae bacterium]|nr:hypothetical protein [Stellaceae bacterium]
MSETPTFSRRALTLWIVAAVVTFASALYLMTQHEGEGGTSGTIGPSTFSRSAIGYAGIAEVLRRLDISTIKSRYNSLSKLGAGSLLVVAEPQPALQTLDSLRALIEAKTVLLILPKWQGRPNETRSDWIGQADLLPESGARWLLDLVANGSEVVRQPVVS